MAKRMHKCYPFIKRIVKTTPKQRAHILKKGPPELLDAISEGALNILKGNVPLSKQKFQQLQRYKNNVKQLATKRTSRRKKRAIILQRGGFMGVLASVLIPTIAALVAARR
jgi:hypothetical protein